MSSPKSDSRFQRVLRTLHTIRHLKPRQALYFFLRRGLGQHRVKPWHGLIPLRELIVPAVPRILHSEISAGAYTFTFLNQKLQFTHACMNWNPADVSRLWRYHLHYFDFLRDRDRSLAEKSALIENWIEHNPQGSKPAWEPYTTSLRIVNWCLFFLAVPRETLKESWLRSLYDQARWLERNLEWHILANHYFENIKAMLFAGFFFADRNGARWINCFQHELIKELAEQTLNDGGHYERSPHYHCILLQSYIELCALHHTNPGLMNADTVTTLTRAIQSGFVFLQAVRTPDGDIPLLNDSVSLSPATLELLTRSVTTLGIKTSPKQVGLIDCPDSGYYGYKNLRDYFLIDCGDIGPTYQPGHTHCDFLSYVLMIDNQWLVVDSGVYEYAPGAMRHYVRSTAAHNTVSVDDCEQSEIWGEFRVGRRAVHEYANIAQTAARIEFEGVFNGFPVIDGGIRHQRHASLELTEHETIAALQIDDAIDGTGVHRLVSHIHLHPDIAAALDDNSIALHRANRLIATLTFDATTTATIETGWYCPDFGNKLPNPVIRLQRSAALPCRFGYRLALHR